MVTKKKPVVVKKVCCKCNKEQPLKSYYNTTYVNIFVDSKLPICKSCILSNIETHGFEEFQNVMKLINKPIYSDLYNNDPKDYIRIVNSMPQYKATTYENSNLFEEKRNVSTVTKVKLEKLSKDELEELVDFFGEGYEEKDYIHLSTEYEDYLNRYEVDSKTLENLIKEICLTQLDIRIKRASNEKVDAQLKTLQDLLGSSNLKPVQETGNQAVEQETFGTLIKKWENERPIPEPDESWKDVDGIRKYVYAFFLSPLARIFGKNNPYEEEIKEMFEEFTVRPPNRDGD